MVVDRGTVFLEQLAFNKEIINRKLNFCAVVFVNLNAKQSDRFNRDRTMT